MSIIDIIQSGVPFWAGEDMLTEYRYFPSDEFPAGYLKKDGAFYCNVRSFTDEGFNVYLKFFGAWQESTIKYTSIAFSPTEIVERIKKI
jgi:hypothetical protein